MTVEVSIFLFGKPAWEIDGFEGGELNEVMIQKIREKGKDLGESLDEAANTLTQLMKKGWGGTGTLYDVILFKDVALGDARRELTEMGLDPESAYELEDDEDDSENHSLIES
jgi:hypothetical protein